MGIFVFSKAPHAIVEVPWAYNIPMRLIESMYTIVGNIIIFFLNLYEGHTYHFMFEMKGFLPTLRVIIHEDFVEEKQHALLHLRKHLPRRRYIQEVLKYANGCHYVIFSKANNEDRFIQVHLGKMRYLIDFPITTRAGKEGNRNGPHFRGVEDALCSFGFTRVYSKIQVLTYMEFQLSKTVRVLDAYCGKNVVLTSSVLEAVFSEVFKDRSGKVEVGLG